MQDDASLTDKEKELACLTEAAASIVRAAEATGSGLTVDEDSKVLALMTRVGALEREINHLKRHPGVRTEP